MKEIDYKEVIFSAIRVREVSDMLNIPLGHTGSIPHSALIMVLQQELGHTSISSTIEYINTAYGAKNIQRKRNLI